MLCFVLTRLNYCMDLSLRMVFIENNFRNIDRFKKISGKKNQKHNRLKPSNCHNNYIC